ncbi:MAG: MFS transporter [Spirochaetaceae bacterium]|nr:MAG: MFS transporter [Spirochaetaceae bacterium]
MLWGLLVLPYTVVYFHRLSLGVLRHDLMAEFALSATAFANIGAAYFYTYTVLQVPAGILSDSLGPRRTVSAAALITALGTTLFALAGSVGMLFLGRLVIGIGVSTIFIAILKLLAVWFDEGEFATLTGLTAGVGTLGGILAQSPLYAAAARWGWRTSFLAVAVFGAVSAVLCFALVRDKPPAGSVPPVHPETHLFRELGAAVRNRRTWPPFLVFGGAYGAFIALSGTWGQSYLVIGLGIPGTVASGMLTWSVIGMAVGGLAFAMISDRLRLRRMPMILCASLLLVCWVLLVSGWVSSGPGLRALLIVLGLSSGVVLTTLPCGKEVNHPAFSGSSTAVVNVGGFLGSALVPLIMGGILDLAAPMMGDAQAYRLVLFVGVASVSVAVVGAFLITETRCRNVYFELNPAKR